LVALAVQKRDEGADMQAVADHVRSLIPRLCHWFTVDDLVYLKRGGRVSPTVAFVGNLLGIKPVLHVDDEGHLINISKVRGRRAAIAALASKYGELLENSEQNTVFISHGDCIGDAELLKDMLESKYGANVTLITPVGTVIGAHSGPGTLAVFFIAKHR
jgi:DegV family protein with EDD domain